MRSLIGKAPELVEEMKKMNVPMLAVTETSRKVTVSYGKRELIRIEDY